jgi:hypothetical protein
MHAECITSADALFTVMSDMTVGELERLLAIIQVIRQQTTKHALYTMTSYQVIMSAEGVTIVDVLKARDVHTSFMVRASTLVSPLPSDPIPRGITIMAIATPLRPTPTSVILSKLELHGMKIAAPLQLAAFINVHASLIGPHPLIAFGHLNRGTRVLKTSTLAYSVRRTEDGKLRFDVRRPDFWMQKPQDGERPTPIQLLLVPKTA